VNLSETLYFIKALRLISIKSLQEQLYIKIQIETQQWPKRKKFFETAYKILLYSKSTTYKFNYMKKLYTIYDVKSPFCEFKEESYNSMVALRDEMEKKKIQILQRLKNNEHNDSTQNLMDEVNDILLKNVLDRILLLTKKIMLTEKFYDVIMDAIAKPNGEIIETIFGDVVKKSSDSVKVLNSRLDILTKTPQFTGRLNRLEKKDTLGLDLRDLDYNILPYSLNFSQVYNNINKTF